MDFQELLLEQYAEPLKGEENAKCKRAIEAVRDALIDMGYIEDKKGVRLLENNAFSYSVSLHNKNTSSRVEVFVQGSYANNTCASNEGDVDIAVACSDTPMYSFGEFYITPLTQRQTEAVSLKNAIENTLKNKFPGQIYRGNKSIKMHGDEYRKQADIVPCVCMRHLILRDSEEKSTWEEGVVIFADDSTTVMNFPKQHIINGNNKDHRTNFNYKKMVRIMKKIRYLMSELGYKSVNEISSFGLESLVWNVPDCYFIKESYYKVIFSKIVTYIYMNKAKLIDYYEVNGIKKLCRTQQDADRYISFIDDLDDFYLHVFCSRGEKYE